MARPDMCTWCGINPPRQSPIGRYTECEACDRYRRRHDGEGRPEYLIVRQMRRKLEEREDE